MSYEKTNWKTGDVITSEKLNKMEEGIAEAGGSGSVSIVSLPIEETHIINSSSNAEVKSLNKTYGQIYNALKNGANVYISTVIAKDETGNILSKNENVYDNVSHVHFFGGEDGCYATVSSINGTFENDFESIDIAFVSYPEVEDESQTLQPISPGDVEEAP